AACVNGATQTACVNNDSCCSAACNANNDGDCKPVCGNSVIESGESCDPLTSCPTTCPQVGCQLRSLTGGGTCAARCVNSGTAGCSGATSDGCCGTNASGAMCTHLTDIDCPVPNDKCDGAIDVSAGGLFSVDLLPQAKADVKAPANCAGVADSPEVFFWFELTQPEWVYLDVLDTTNPAVTPVGLSIELYDSACPTQGKLIACADGTVGTKRCPGPVGAAGLAIPVIDSGRGGVLGKPMPAGKYWVAIRLNKENPGRWAFRYDHVPVACVPTANELVIPASGTGVLGTTTCQQGDEFDPTCAPRASALSGLDMTYMVIKCPNQLASFTTCAGKTVSDTVLSAAMGSFAFAKDKGCTPVGDGKELACDAGDPNSRLCPFPGSGSVTVDTARSGLLIVNVDAQPNAAGATCGSFELDYCAAKTCATPQ
ncbi:MAG: hypothetical protein ABUL67_00320, partial [Haliangium ochraceum]